MKTFAVFEVPAAAPGTTEVVRVVEGTAARCVAALLGHVSLPELNRLKLELIGAEQRRRVALRVAAETARTGVAFPAPDADAYSLVPPEADEDGEEILEPTPVETFPPDAGPRR